MKLLILSLLISVACHAAEVYPQLYGQMGDPLYAFGNKMAAIEHDAVLGEGVREYRSEAAETRQFGLKAETSAEDRQKQLYLQRLRTLEKQQRQMMAGIKAALDASMKQNDFPRFAALMQTEPSVLMQSKTFRTESMTFYKKQRGKRRVSFLDEYMRAEQQRQKQIVQAEKAEREVPEESYREWMDAIGSSGDVESSGPRTAQRSKPASKTMSYRDAAKHVSKQDHYVSQHRKPVVVLTTKTCPACKKAKQFFRDERIMYREYDIKTSREGEQLFRKHNGHAVPMIIVGDKVMTGLDRGWFLNHYK